jgi:MFS family permease
MNAVYSLVFASLLITVGRVGDLRGRRRLFLIGMLVFMTASVFAGLAVNGPMLIAARFVQGIGAAMILPTTLSSLNALFTGRARVVAFAVYGSAIGGMAALGRSSAGGSPRTTPGGGRSGSASRWGCSSSSASCARSPRPVTSRLPRVGTCSELPCR